MFNHLFIVTTLSNFVQVQRNRHKYELVLEYEIKCYLVHERVVSPDDENIGQSFSNIAECYEHLNQLKMTLDYYERALAIYEQCPSCLSDIKYQIKTIITRLL
ncbi:unnamed protein product [Adineta steineri]|uniref:Tetratricopeptide repeat protein n=1 Tax=Adineta steineri TaxID=433720 RepID=A0A814GDF4_9BILA|nr:unnamed protein product [Adineta steineri]CAF0994217.1 unnamed protein product [Adineta steineri]